MMTLQEIFDKCAAHLQNQNKRAVEMVDAPVKEHCKYRYKGLTCVVGCLITDEAYAPELEGMGVGFRRVAQALVESNVLSPEIIAEVVWQNMPPERKLLERLQSLHDSYQPHEWRSHLICIAEDYRLVFH